MQAQTVPRRKTLRRNLTAMNADGFSFSVMVGIAETYLPAFVLARGLGEVNAALIATVPVLLGSVLQLLAPMALQRLKSYRRFVVMTASIQASSMLVLMIMALTPHVPAWAVFIPATLYWAAGLSTGPAWNTWVEYLVPQRIRSGFFARRSRMCHIGVLLGLISGGLFLRWSVAHEMTVAVFAVLFGIGAIGRFVSAGMLARQTEQTTTGGIAHVHSDPEARQDGSSADEDTDIPRIVSARDRFAALVQAVKKPGSAGRLVLFLMAVQTAVHVSGPYFNPYMLRILKLSWMEYMGLLSLGFIGKMISLPWAGRFANRFGPDRLLWVGSIGIVPVSALWFFSSSVWWLAGIQILSGLVWGCYELAMLLQFFRQIPGERRVAVLTLYNLGNSAAMVLGTVIGGVILNALGRSIDAYLTLFVASGCLRFFALVAMPNRQEAVVSTR
ncbi:MAG: MFS transporter, partial [Planctomycetota bacterium]|nr:MFS transporter [Planctomycetota bacterium]